MAYRLGPGDSVPPTAAAGSIVVEEQNTCWVPVASSVPTAAADFVEENRRVPVASSMPPVVLESVERPTWALVFAVSSGQLQKVALAEARNWRRVDAVDHNNSDELQHSPFPTH